LRELLGKESLDAIGLFDSTYVERLVEEHIQGQRDNRKQLWTLLVFVLWWKRWMV
jgi:asparagine synthase (glutamine-hydrolysing)